MEWLPMPVLIAIVLCMALGSVTKSAWFVKGIITNRARKRKAAKKRYRDDR
jgi:hypothetical protein